MRISIFSFFFLFFFVLFFYSILTVMRISLGDTGEVSCAQNWFKQARFFSANNSKAFSLLQVFLFMRWRFHMSHMFCD